MLSMGHVVISIDDMKIITLCRKIDTGGLLAERDCHSGR